MRSFDGFVNYSIQQCKCFGKRNKKESDNNNRKHTHPFNDPLSWTIRVSFFTGQMPFLPPTQKRQNTEGKTTTENKGGNSSVPSVLMIMIVLMTS